MGILWWPVGTLQFTSSFTLNPLTLEFYFLHSLSLQRLTKMMWHFLPSLTFSRTMGYSINEDEGRGVLDVTFPFSGPMLVGFHVPNTHLFLSYYSLCVQCHCPHLFTDSSYSEPPDVQQQLNHYQSAALARNNSRVSPVPHSGAAGGTEQKTEAVLHCEFCEFSSGYIQSIRRHYKDKHGGKKLFKCKDCSFYTGFK